MTPDCGFIPFPLGGIAKFAATNYKMVHILNFKLFDSAGMMTVKLKVPWTSVYTIIHIVADLEESSREDDINKGQRILWGETIRLKTCEG